MIAPVRPTSHFQIGQLVKHRRYGYRGVILSVDPFCMAPDEWYRSNKTQPNRDQPWYHVLVDGSNSLTYAAETSLEQDDCAQPIEHPLTDHFFSEFDGQRYIRNNREFEGW